MSETSDLLVASKQLSTEIRECLPSGFDIGSVSTEAKIPSKALSLRESLIHRAADLAETAILLIEKEKFVPACIITRSLMETTGMLFWLHKKIQRAVQDGSIDGIDEFMMRGLVGAREDGYEFPALSAYSAIKHVSKEYESFLTMYDDLCEFTHPNWSGTFGTYGHLNKERCVWSLARRLKINRGISYLLRSFCH